VRAPAAGLCGAKAKGTFTVEPVASTPCHLPLLFLLPQGFPTLIFFPAEKDAKPIPYEGGRTLGVSPARGFHQFDTHCCTHLGWGPHGEVGLQGAQRACS